MNNHPIENPTRPSYRNTSGCQSFRHILKRGILGSERALYRLLTAVSSEQKRKKGGQALSYWPVRVKDCGYKDYKLTWAYTYRRGLAFNLAGS